MKEDFLGYLGKWKKSVSERKDVSKTQKNKMMLSTETLLGLRITGNSASIMATCYYNYFDCHAVNSFVEMMEYIFTIPGVKVFLSNRICQDPLENFFGRQRQRGRVNENPTALDFIRNTQALRIVNIECATVRGNCRGEKTKRKRQEPIMVENTPLVKRQKKH